MSEDRGFIIQLNLLPSERERYDNTIVIEIVQVKGDTYKIEFFNLVSNFDGFFKYQLVEPSQVNRIDFANGRY